MGAILFAIGTIAMAVLVLWSLANDRADANGPGRTVGLLAMREPNEGAGLPEAEADPLAGRAFTEQVPIWRRPKRRKL